MLTRVCLNPIRRTIVAQTIDKPSHFKVGDAQELLKRASSKALSGWGRADQELPQL